ncbi:Gfo/Idh/MocA family protein [Comamonas composti]|uniref:Gfo/Idh/MocA family protein n=1 Tax=Comamonas composti TaxID=408558 RepID=UPI00054FC2D6|nr:Gfo/Idh/MocA family oxidoreductase [Comamonas composti]
MTRKLRLGMVGGGEGAFIGGVHRTAAQLDGHYELLAAALSSEPQRAARSAAALGLDPERSYADYREMARAEAARPDGIEVVSIVTPNHLHAPVATAFLEAGMHVICDKPLALSLQEGETLAALARQRQRVFALTHPYAGYAMVRHARALVRNGALGALRLVQVEYQQDWLSQPIEQDGQHKQACWRLDPARSGPTGCLGDIGSHAYQLAAFVSGMLPSQVSAELCSFVPGRQLDDHAQMMLRYTCGARGLLWASQVAAGCANALRLRIFGSQAGLAFDQERPDELWLTPVGGAAQCLRQGHVDSAAARHASRVPAGHPQGYQEAFAQLYVDAAEQIRARQQARAPFPESLDLPTIEDGLAGHRFIDAALASHRKNGLWMDIQAVRNAH